MKKNMNLTLKYFLALFMFFYFSADGHDYALQTISKGQRLLDLFRARKCAKKNWALDMEKSCAFVKEDLNKKKDIHDPLYESHGG
jgi:hypothetical protein